MVLHEHPEWQKPLFAALERRGLAFMPFDVTRAAFSNIVPPRAPLYFNQASPSVSPARQHAGGSAGARLHADACPPRRARPERCRRFALELSKSAQATLLRTLGIDSPRSITFNDARALRGYHGDVRWPALLEPDQGGSGARIQVVESLAHVEDHLPPRPVGVVAGQPVPAAGIPAARSRTGHRAPGVP